MNSAENQLIQKYVSQSVFLINELLYTNAFQVAGSSTFLDGRTIELAKEQNELKLSFKVAFNERKLLNDVLDIKIKAFQLLGEGTRVYTVPEKGTLLNNVKEINNTPDFEVYGSITRIHTSSLNEFDGKFQRVFIPVDDKQFTLLDFENYFFNTDEKTSNKQLIKLRILDMDFHLFTFKFNDKTFWGIDVLNKLEFKKFQEIAFSICNAYGFIDGDLHLNEAYYFASDHVDFSVIDHFLFTSIRKSIYTGYGIYSRNPYAYYVPFYKQKGEPLDHEFIKTWYDLLGQFPASILEKLAQNFYEHEALGRAALIVLEANNQPLELKAASYCVAFEAVCNTIKDVFGIDSPKVLDKTLWKKDIKPPFDRVLKELLANGTIDVNQNKILTNRLNDWNRPTNADTLTAPFKKFGYTISEDEFNCINNRNSFLHGRLPVNESNEEEVFGELYHISLTLHKLLYVLLLKMAGYNGYIVNYPKLHSYITGRTVNEELFIKIG